MWTSSTIKGNTADSQLLCRLQKIYELCKKRLMTCERVNYRITCFVLNILFSFLCIEAFSQDRENTIAWDGITSGTDSIAGHYNIVIGKETSEKKDIDRNNVKRFRHALKKYDDSEVASFLKETVRHEFSEEVELAFMYCVISKSGRLEYVELILNDADGKTLIQKYSDKQYRKFMDRVHETIEFTPWECPGSFCIGAFNLRWEK